LDGNKRTAIISALTFLQVNGVQTRYSEEKLYDLMIGIAEKRASKADLAGFFRANSNG
jgi:prophage maintenance system killer protein